MKKVYKYFLLKVDNMVGNVSRQLFQVKYCSFSTKGFSKGFVYELGEIASKVVKDYQNCVWNTEFPLYIVSLSANGPIRSC